MTEDTSLGSGDLFRLPERIDDWAPPPLPGELLRDYLIRIITEEDMAGFFEWCLQ